MEQADDPRTDAELLGATTEDPDAFAVFYRRHAGWVRRVCLRRCGDRELAADITAETFAAALAAAGRFDPARGSAGPWLFQIALNKLADDGRRGAAERRAHERVGAPPLAAAEEIARIDELLSLSAGGDAGPLLAALPDEQRRAVEARVIDERGYDDIAAELGLSQAAARQRVSRGLTTLRRRLRRAAGPVPIAVGALLALGGVAAALALSGDERGRSRPAPLPATPALPEVCGEQGRSGTVPLTAAPVDPELLGRFALLRRPQRPSDLRDCPTISSVAYNPGAIRRLPDDVNRSRWMLLPVDIPADVATGMTGPGFCIGRTAADTRTGGSGGYCMTARQMRDGERPLIFGRVTQGGVVSDDVAEIEVRMDSGRRERYPVRGNVWRYLAVTREQAEDDPVATLIERDAAGEVVTTFTDRGFMPRSPR